MYTATSPPPGIGALLCCYAAFLVVVTGTGQALASGGIASLSSIKSGPVTVYYTPADEPLAGEVSKRATLIHRRIMEDLGLRSEITAAILLLTRNSSDGALKEIARGLPPWLAGAAYRESQHIILRMRPGQSAPDYDSLLAHELTHVILKGDYPAMSQWPRWFQEGLAMRESRGEGLRVYTSLSLASLRQGIIPLGELIAAFPESERASRLAYAESFSMISFLVGRYGRGHFLQLMEVLRTSAFGDAIVKVYGRDISDIENDWLHYLKRRYQWVPLLTGGAAFWGLTLLVFFVSLAARRRKTRRLEEEWAADERWEDR